MRNSGTARSRIVRWQNPIASAAAAARLTGMEAIGTCLGCDTCAPDLRADADVGAPRRVGRGHVRVRAR
jgi:hypothetical protein